MNQSPWASQIQVQSRFSVPASSPVPERRSSGGGAFCIAGSVFALFGLGEIPMTHLLSAMKVLGGTYPAGPSRTNDDCR